jgi:hypothetical protein
MTIRLAILLLSALCALGQNVTNLYVGQQLYVGLPLTIVPSGGGAFTANAVTYTAASSQYLTKASGAIAASTSQTFVLSIWFNPSDANTRDIVNLGLWPIFFVEKKGAGTVHITAATTAGATVLDATSSLTWTQGAWNHLLISVDLSNTSKRWIYLNGTQDGSVTWTTYSSATNIGWTYSAGANGIANNALGGSIYGGCLSEIYLNAGQYLDFSASTNRDKFVSGGHPVSLGSDGSTPTGTQPQIYMKDPAATAGNNSGSMGDFTINGGPLSSCTSP